MNTSDVKAAVKDPRAPAHLTSDSNAVEPKMVGMTSHVCRSPNSRRSGNAFQAAAADGQGSDRGHRQKRQTPPHV